MDTEAMRARARSLMAEVVGCGLDRCKTPPCPCEDTIYEALTAAHAAGRAEGKREERERCWRIAAGGDVAAASWPIRALIADDIRGQPYVDRREK